MNTVVILSGGMDSTTLLYKVLKDRQHGDHVKAISFHYGQRHKRELECAAETCANLGVEHKIIDIGFLKEIASNSSLTGDIPTPHGHYAAENMKKTVVPNRNMIMASIAIGWAVNLEYDQVATGVHAGDHTIYPDCRPDYIEALRAIAAIANFQPIGIYTPYLHLDKGDIAIEGTNLGVNYSLTHTCYEGTAVPCGKCGACQERAEAFAKARRPDPLVI